LKKYLIHDDPDFPYVDELEIIWQETDMQKRSARLDGVKIILLNDTKSESMMK
jgi:hypothetical protein